MADRSWVSGAVGAWRSRARGAPGPPGDDSTPAPARAARRPYLLASSWLYAAVAVASTLLVLGMGDAWWPVTLLLFMPRWLFLGPVAVLAFASARGRCYRHWAIQGATAAVVAGPLMGGSLAAHRLYRSPPAGDVVRIATYNLGLEKIRGDDLRRWIEREGIDVVCFQEGWIDDVALRPVLPDGWRLGRKGSIATRLAVVADVADLPPQVDEDGKPYTSRLERWRLRAPSGRVFEVASVHLPTMRFGIERFLAHGDPEGIRYHKRKWAREMTRILSSLVRGGGVPLIVGGDFNMPFEDTTMSTLLEGFRGAFEQAGRGYGYTRPARCPWARIDHILAGPGWYVAACYVGPDFGSDHLPLVAELVLPGPSTAPDAGASLSGAGGATPRRPGRGPSAWAWAPGSTRGFPESFLHATGAE